MILGIAYLDRQTTTDLGQPAFGGLTTAVDFGLDIRRVAEAAMPFKEILVLGLAEGSELLVFRKAAVRLDVSRKRTRENRMVRMNLGSIGRCLVVFLCGALGLGFGEDSGGAQPVTSDGLMLWLRADQAGELDDAGHVATWKNYAPGTDQHAHQSRSDWRPRWIESVGSFGGQPALEFDGVDDFLHLPWLRIGAETTVILVAENSAQTEGGSYWRAVLSGDDDSFRDEATKYAFSFRRADYDPLFIANLYYAPGQAHRLTQSAGTSLRTGFFLYTFRRHGSLPAGTSLRVDGATVGSLTAEPDPAGFPGTGYTIGQGGDVNANRRFRFYCGRIAEILIYDRALPKVQLWPVEAYLADKYRLPRAYAPPTDGLKLWLNADSLPAPDDEAEIERWPDDSGHGHDGTQAEPARRPHYVARGINRRAALDFRDGFAQLDFGGWVPPADGTAYAALRRVPHERARIEQVCPAIGAQPAGTDKPFRGRLGELLVYDRQLSPEEAYQVRQYLDHRYCESPDLRWFDNGTLIFHNGYNDQPYLVSCHDGSWLCVITTSRISEQGADRTLVVTRSRDQGQTWSEPVASIEPPELRQPSWGTLYVTPYGRVYVFYNLRERADGPSPIGFFFKYSDDHGATWSDQRYRIPIRKIAIDDQMPGIGGWSVSPPVALGPDVLVSYTRYGSHGKRSQGQGFVFRSDNLQTERHAERIRWEMHLECRSDSGRGWTVTTAEDQALRLELSDGRHAFEHWSTDTGLLGAGRRHQVTWIVDGGPNLILPVVDGVLGDGGEAASGWGRFSSRLTDVTDDGSKLRFAPQLEARIEQLRIYSRPLRVAEAIGIHRHDKGRSREPNGTQ